MVLKKHLARLCAVSLALFTAALPLSALSVPALTGRVVDEGNALSASQENQISSYLESLEDTTGIQIAVLTVPSLEGSDIETYSMRVADEWKLGSAKEDNGALLLVAMAEHKVRIEVGYGLEDKLTDAKCGLIIRNVITPQFRTGDYGEGIYEGVQNMGDIASDNVALVSKSVANAESTHDDDSAAGAIFAIIFFVVWMTIIPTVAFSRHRRGSILPWLILSGLSNSHHNNHNNHSNHSSFGGGFGGGSHGGFSGGGGGFGGGGASGGW